MPSSRIEARFHGRDRGHGDDGDEHEQDQQRREEAPGPPGPELLAARCGPTAAIP